MFLDSIREDYESSYEPPSAAAQGRPWVTLVVMGACVVVFLTLMGHPDRESPEILLKFGYAPADEIYHGAVWALITSAFIHAAPWHLVFNLYWLWVLGSVMEHSMGAARYALFFVAAAFISSSFQLAVSDSTGIGASGAGYAIFGYVWIMRRRPAFARVLSQQTVYLFLVWMVGCFAVTLVGAVNVGNAAHFTGLLFGVAVGGVAARYKPPLPWAGVAALAFLATGTLFWNPWSPAWLMTKANDAHIAERYPEALRYYDRILELEPDNAYAYANRGGTYRALGDLAQARADVNRAHDLDPKNTDAPWHITWLQQQAYDAHAAGKLDEALALYNQIIKHAPEDAWAYSNRSDLFRLKGDLVRAEQDQARAEELNPIVGAQANKIRTLMQQAYDAQVAGKADEAVRLYTQVIEASPMDAWAYANRSMAYTLLGELDKSQADHETAIRLDPHVFDDVPEAQAPGGD